MYKIISAIFTTIWVVILIAVIFAVLAFLAAVPIIGWTLLFIVIVILIFLHVLEE